MYLCKCGRFKSSQPYKSNVTKDWICAGCADRGVKPRPIGLEREYAASIEKSVRIGIKIRKAGKKSPS